MHKEALLMLLCRRILFSSSLRSWHSKLTTTDRHVMYNEEIEQFNDATSKIINMQRKAF
jgi:hypothetical protein